MNTVKRRAFVWSPLFSGHCGAWRRAVSASTGSHPRALDRVVFVMAAPSRSWPLRRLSSHRARIVHARRYSSGRWLQCSRDALRPHVLQW